MNREARYQLARVTLKGLRYDRDKWRPHVTVPVEHPDVVDLYVDTTKPDKATGLFSHAWQGIPRKAFESSITLKAVMQSAIEMCIEEIKALPPPTAEEARTLVES